MKKKKKLMKEIALHTPDLNMLRNIQVEILKNNSDLLKWIE